MKIKLILMVILVPITNIISMAQNNQIDQTQNHAWLDTLIAKGKIGKSPITDIKSYIYNNKLVYLINFDAGCCDQFSAVLKDETGKTICHPFGGISGKGDMQCVDFMRDKSNEKFVWVNKNFENTDAQPKERSFKMEKSKK